MILVDANLLLYAYNENYSENAATKTWLDDVLLNAPRVGLPWPSLLAFVRLSTNPRIFSKPASIREAWQQVQFWLACPSAWIPEATDRHVHHLTACLEAVSTSNGVPDAHLAALALEHGLVLCSADAGFAKFPGLRVYNPLKPGKK